MSRQRPSLPRNREPCAAPSAASSDSFWHSEPSPLLLGHRSTRELPATADVVIVGSGMTGTSVAHHLLTSQPNQDEKSFSVVMLEAREACWGATGRNGGHCQPLLIENPHDPSIGRFELANFHDLEFLIAQKNIDCEFVAQPAVRAIYDHHHLTDAELALLKMEQTDPAMAKMMRLVTDKAELKRLRIPTAVGAVVTSVAARMWPYKFVSRLLEDLLTSTELRGKFNLQTLTPVEGIVAGEGDRWTVQTSRGSVVASKLVLATNAYTSHLLPGFADLIVPCRGQMSALEPLPSLRQSSRLTASYGFLGDALDDYLIQRPDERGGHLMFGGGRQNAASIGVTDDSVVDEKTAQYLRSRLIEAFELPEGKPPNGMCDYCRRRKIRCVPDTVPSSRGCANCRRQHKRCTTTHCAEFTASHEWTGIMGFSRDEFPWVGPVPDQPNLYISAGYTGHGMPNTWLCGKAVAYMIEKTTEDVPVMDAGVPSGSSAQREENARLQTKFSNGGSMHGAVQEIGLPECYLITKARILRAMDLEDVEARDWAERARGRRRGAEDRPPSGYA